MYLAKTNSYTEPSECLMFMHRLQFAYAACLGLILQAMFTTPSESVPILGLFK